MGQELKNKSEKDLRELYMEYLENGVHGLCFSSYVEGQEPGDVITEEQIRARMEIIRPYTKWIRAFSCTDGNELIAKVAKDYGIKVMAGAWLGTDMEKNEEEIANLVKIVKEGYVDLAAVGNEVLYREELTEDELLEYLRRVKEQIPGTPVGYVDTATLINSSCGSLEVQ